MIQEALFKAAGPRTQSEIYLSDFQPSSNVIFQTGSYLAQHQSHLLSESREWTQVFDLNDTALIVWVQGNQMQLRLMHITEQPQKQFYEYVQQKVFQMPTDSTAIRNFRFIKTEEEEKNQLKHVFQQYNAAKLIVDGNIVTNLALNNSTSLVPNYKRYGQEVDSQRRTLSFITTSNMLYEIDFDRYFFKAKETVFVKERRMSQLEGVAKAFDLVLDQQYNQFVYVIGTSISLNAQDAQNQNQIKAAYDQTLYFIRQEHGTQEFVYQQINLPKRNFDNFFKKITNQVNSFFSNRIMGGNIGTQSKRVQPDNRFGSRTGFEEGIVSLKAFSNGLIGVVYTSGDLRIWSILTGKCIVEYSLLDSQQEEANQDQTLKQTKQIVAAKLQSLSFPFSVDSGTKSIKLALAYAVSSFKEPSLTWSVDQFTLTFTDLSFDNIDRVNEDWFDLSSFPLNFTPFMQLQVPEQVFVNDMVLEKTSKSIHLWMVTYQKDLKRSQIVDISNSKEIIWDSESKQEYEKMFDEIDLSFESRTHPQTTYKKEIMDHFYERITKPGRFSSITLKDQLCKLGFDEQQVNNSDLHDLVMRVISESTFVQLQDLLAQLILTEKENSEVYGLSPLFRDFPFRFLLRPLGVSLLKQDSFFSSLVNRSHSLSSQLYQSLNKEAQSFAYQEGSQYHLSQLITAHLSNPLLALLSSLTVLHSSLLHQLDQSLLTQPTPTQDLRSLLIQAFRESYHYEALNVEILKLINAQRLEIEDQVNQVTESVVQMLERQAESGGGIYDGAGIRRRQEIIMGGAGTAEFNKLIVKVFERGVMEEMDNLRVLLRNLLMLKVFLQLNKPMINPISDSVKYDSSLFNSMTFWLLQLSALTNTLSQRLELSQLNSYKYYPLLVQLQQSDDIAPQSPSVMLIMMLSLPEVQLQNSLAETYNNVDLSLHTMHQENGVGPHPQQLSITEGRGAMFTNMMVRMVQKYMFNEKMKEQTYVPEIVKKLYQMKQYQLIGAYLEPLNEISTIALEFMRALICAQNNAKPSEFLDHMCNCFAKFHQSLIQNEKVKYLNLILDKKMRNLNNVPNSRNEVVLFYATILSQLVNSNLDERYSLFVINSALLEETIVNPDDKDYFYERMFNIATVQTSADYMYMACTQISNLDKKKALIGQFFERLCTTTSTGAQDFKHLLYSMYFFSPEDVDLGLKYLQDRVIYLISEDTKNKQAKGQKDMLKQIQSSVEVVNIVAQLYQRQVQNGRFLWEAQRKIEERIEREYKNEKYAEKFVELLELQEVILLVLYFNAKQFEEHQFITDDSQIHEPSKKRKNYEISNSSSNINPLLTNAINQSDELIRQKGYDVLKEIGTTSLKFYSGQLQRITLSDIEQKLVKIGAKIKVAQFFNTNDEELLMKIMVEMKEYEWALRVAQVFKLGIGYPMAYLIKHLKEQGQVQVDINGQAPSQDQQNIWHMSWSNTNDLQITKSSSSLFTLTFSYYTFPSLTLIDLLDLAQSLVSAKQPLPQTLTHLLIQEGQLKELLEFYLTDDFFDFPMLIELVRSQMPQGIQDLIKSELQLVVRIMRYMEDGIVENQDVLAEIKENKRLVDNLINSENRMYGAADLHIKDDIAEELEGFLGHGNLQEYRVKYNPKLVERYERIDVLRKDIVQTEEILDQLVKGLAEIKEILIETLNKFD